MLALNSKYVQCFGGQFAESNTHSLKIQHKTRGKRLDKQNEAVSGKAPISKEPCNTL